MVLVANKSLSYLILKLFAKIEMVNKTSFDFFPLSSSSLVFAICHAIVNYATNLKVILFASFHALGHFLKYHKGRLLLGQAVNSMKISERGKPIYSLTAFINFEPFYA
jgi:hypothetical protein